MWDEWPYFWGWGGEVIVLSFGCGRAGVKFFVGMDVIFRKHVFASMLSHAA